MEQAAPSPGAHGLVHVELWHQDLREALERHGDALVSLLSADERARADRFVFVRDRNRFVAARAILRRILAGYMNTTPEALAFDYGPQGKPMLRPTDGSLAPRFNLSHSGDHALIAVTRGADVGVDIECERPLPDIAGVIAVICSESEKQHLARLSEADRIAVFWRLWTAKEAVLKGEGSGFTRPPHEVEFIISCSGRTWTPILQPPLGDAWRLVSLVPCAGYVGAVAVRSGADPVIRHRCSPGSV